MPVVDACGSQQAEAPSSERKMICIRPLVVLVASIACAIVPSLGHSAGERKVQERDGTGTVRDSAGNNRPVRINPTSVGSLSEDVLVTPDLIYTEATKAAVVDENNEAPDGAPPSPYNYAIILSNGDVLTKEGAGAPLVFWGRASDFKNRYYYKARDLQVIANGSGYFYDTWFRATNERVVASYVGSGQNGYTGDVPQGSFERVPAGCSTSGWKTTNLSGEQYVEYRVTAHAANTRGRVFSGECPALKETLQMGPFTISVWPAHFVLESIFRNSATQKNGFSIVGKTAFVDVDSVKNRYDYGYYTDDQNLDGLGGGANQMAVTLFGQSFVEAPASSASGTWDILDETDVHVMLLYMGNRNLGVSACVKSYKYDGSLSEWRTPHTSRIENVWTRLRYGALCDAVHEKIAEGVGIWYIANTASAIFGVEVASDTESTWRVPRTTDDFTYIERAMNGAESVTLANYNMTGKKAQFLLDEIKVK